MEEQKKIALVNKITCGKIEGTCNIEAKKKSCSNRENKDKKLSNKLPKKDNLKSNILNNNKKIEAKSNGGAQVAPNKRLSQNLNQQKQSTVPANKLSTHNSPNQPQHNQTLQPKCGLSKKPSSNEYQPVGYTKPLSTNINCQENETPKFAEKKTINAEYENINILFIK
uniref:Uncharacterized protein n=1 Tax=Strongyloides stercoralis TaxID=6248 RepID=A0A0K0ECC4_STRER